MSTTRPNSPAPSSSNWNKDRPSRTMVASIQMTMTVRHRCRPARAQNGRAGCWKNGHKHGEPKEAEGPEPMECFRIRPVASQHKGHNGRPLVAPQESL